MMSRGSDVHDCSSCRAKDKKMERMLMTIEEVQAELVEARKQAAESASAHFAASAQHKEALEQLADALEKEREDMAEELTKTAEDFARTVSESQSLSAQLQDERNRRVTIETRLFNSEKHNREVAESLRSIETELRTARDRTKALALEKTKLQEDLTKAKAAEEMRDHSKKDLEGALAATKNSLNDLQVKYAQLSSDQDIEKHIQQAGAITPREADLLTAVQKLEQENASLKNTVRRLEGAMGNLGGVMGAASKDRMLLALEVQLEEAMCVMAKLQGERDEAVEKQLGLQGRVTSLQNAKEMLERERDVRERARKEIANRDGERKDREGQELQELHNAFILLRTESRRKAEESAEGDAKVGALAEECLKGLGQVERALAALAAREAAVSARERKYEQQYDMLRAAAAAGGGAPRAQQHRRSWVAGEGVGLSEVPLAGGGVAGWEASMADPELMASGKKRRRAEHKRDLEHKDGDSREGDSEEKTTREPSPTGAPLGRAEWEVKAAGVEGAASGVPRHASGPAGPGRAGPGLGLEFSRSLSPSEWERERQRERELANNRGVSDLDQHTEDRDAEEGEEEEEGEEDDCDWVEVPEWEEAAPSRPGEVRESEGGERGWSEGAGDRVMETRGVEEEEMEEEEEEMEEGGKEALPLRLGSGLLGSLSPSMTVLSRSPPTSNRSPPPSDRSPPPSNRSPPASARSPAASVRRSRPSPSPSPSPSLNSSASVISTPPRPTRLSATPPSTPEDRLSASMVYHEGLAREQHKAEQQESGMDLGGAEDGIRGLQMDEEEEEESWKRREVEEGRVEGYLSMLLNRLHLHWTGIRVDYNVARSLILVAEVVANSPAHQSGEICVGDVLASLGGQQLEGRPARVLVDALDNAPRSRLDLALRPQHSPADLVHVTLIRPPAPPPSPSSMPPLRPKIPPVGLRPQPEEAEQELSPRERGQSITRMGGVILVGAGGPRKKSPRGMEGAEAAHAARKQAASLAREGGAPVPALATAGPTDAGAAGQGQGQGAARVDAEEHVGSSNGEVKAGAGGDAKGEGSESAGGRAGGLGGPSAGTDFASKIKAWDARKRERIKKAGRHTTGSELRSI